MAARVVIPHALARQVVMWNRIGILGGAAVVLALVILYGTYQVQDEPFPNWLFVGFVVVGVILLVGGALAWSAAFIILPIRSFFAARYFRWPFPRKDAPDPSAWLVEIVEQHCNAPQNHLYVMDQSIDLRYLDNPEPYFIVTYTIANGSIYPITWEPTCEGRTMINSKPLESPLELLEGGGGRWVPGHRGRIRVRQYVSKDSVGEIKGLVKGTVDCGMINNLLDVGATLEVTPECEGGVPVKYAPLAHHRKDFFVTPNR